MLLANMHKEAYNGEVTRFKPATDERVTVKLGKVEFTMVRIESPKLFDRFEDWRGKLPEAFYVSETPVSEALWSEVMNPGLGCNRKSYPIVNVSTFAIDEFIKRVNCILNAENSKVHGEFTCPHPLFYDAIIKMDLQTFSGEHKCYRDYVRPTCPFPMGKDNPDAFGLHNILGLVWEIGQLMCVEENHLFGGSYRTEDIQSDHYQLGLNPEQCRRNDVGFRLMSTDLQVAECKKLNVIY